MVFGKCQKAGEYSISIMHYVRSVSSVISVAKLVFAAGNQSRAALV